MEEKLRKALRADFHRLYVKEFTANWQAERFIRDIEIGVMSLENTIALLERMKK